MAKTCGIFIRNCRGEILACHPTNAPESVWSIPKGIPNDNESDWEAAKRELFEETGLLLDKIEYVNFRKLPEVKYKNNKKKLISFIVDLKEDIKDIELKCSSFVECRNPFPEVDKFKWMTVDEVNKFLHITQINAFNGK